MERKGILKRGLASLGLCALAACGGPEPIDVFAFIGEFRASRYLDLAVRIQRLESPAREAALRELAQDRRRASDVYPLCRMLFEAKEKGEFRRPMIGGAHFLGSTTYDDWPLEPITIFQGMPILVVTGYVLAGHPEPPGGYVEYCLKECRWKDTKFAPIEAATRREIVAKFIAENPKLDADWLRPQAG